MNELICHSPQTSGRCTHQREQPGNSNIVILGVIPLALDGYWMVR